MGIKMPEHYLKTELYSFMLRDEAFFEFLQEGSLDGLWYWDLEAPLNEWMSPRFWTVLGYDPAERKHLSSEWQDIVYSDDLKVMLDNFRSHCQDPSHPYDQVVRFRHKDGSTVWVRCRGIAIRDESGRPVRMLGAHTDLTKQKRVEAELLEKTAELVEVNGKLSAALESIQTLKGLIPICSHCKNIRDDGGYWEKVEAYLAKHSKASFSHSICPDCMQKHYPDLKICENPEGEVKSAVGES
jgi:PAS domain S-box-containing protein